MEDVSLGCQEIRRSAMEDVSLRPHGKSVVELTPEEVEVLTEDQPEGTFRHKEQFYLRTKPRDHRGIHSFPGCRVDG